MKIHIVTITLAAILATSSCKNNGGSTSTPPQPVKTCLPVACSDGSSLVFPGKVISDDKAYTAFKVAGRIASISVKEGDTVKAGQTIGRLDDTDYRVALEAVEAEYNSINSEAQRVIAIYNENATTKAAYDKAVYGLQQISAKLEHARNQLNDTRLTAPSSGVVKTILRHAGEVVGAGTPVLEIIDNSAPLVEIKVPASTFADLNRYTDYTCTFDAYPGKVFNLKMFAGQSVANANQLYSVKLAFDDAGDTQPAVGMSAMVTMRTGEGVPDSNTDKWLVPSTALAGSGPQTHIYIVGNDSTLQRIDVEVVKMTRDGNAEISCARPLDCVTVVAAGAGKLHENDRVTPIAPATATNVGNQL